MSTQGTRMTITKMIFNYLILILFLFSVSESFAHNNNSVTLINEHSTSLEKCPVSDTSMELTCKSYQQTTNYTCGPAVIMTLLRYYHVLSAKDMNQSTELRIAREMGADNGSTASQVEAWLSNHGFNVESGQKITTDTLIDNVKRGIPTIVAYNQHWILAKGYNKTSTPSQDEIIFADSCCNVRIISREIIDSMWVEALMPSNHCGGNIGTYLVAIPKK